MQRDQISGQFWALSFGRTGCKFLPLFMRCITWIVGNGASTYWYNPWQGTPLIDTLEEGQRPRQPRISMRDAIPIRHNLHDDHMDLENVLFTTQRDSMQWKWTTQGLYTASSIYKILVGAGKIGPQWYSSGSFAYRPLFGSSYSYCSKRRYWHRMWWGVGTWVQTWAVRSVCNAL